MPRRRRSSRRLTGAVGPGRRSSVAPPPGDWCSAWAFPQVASGLTVRRKVPPCHDGTQNGTCERAIQPVHWAAMSDYAARIRAARAYAGLKQDELAERLGVDT